MRRGAGLGKPNYGGRRGGTQVGNTPLYKELGKAGRERAETVEGTMMFDRLLAFLDK